MNLLQRLQEILNSARVSDDEIRGGIKISEEGLRKLSSRLNITVSEVKDVLAQLVTKLRDEHDADMTAVYESEGDPRFAYETDFMGNLTVRDSKTGEEHYLSGSNSAHVVKKLKATENGSEEEQLLLQRICTDSASVLQEDPEAADDFIAELKNDAGSYNFPWRVGKRHGTGTAAYRANAKEFKLQVVSIRDHRGEEMNADGGLTDEITKQARDFIGQE